MTSPQPPEPAPTFFLQSVGVEATAQIRDGKFVVLAGSEARAEVVDSYEQYVSPGYRAHRTRLIAEGILQPDGATGELRFTQDEAFKGSTEAGCVVAGRIVNGLCDWFLRLPDDSKQTHGQWLETAPPAVLAALTETGPYEFSAAWKPIFRELAGRLLDYRDRQSELVDILHSAGVRIQHDEGEPLLVMDPFSFFSLILKHQSETRVAEILTQIKAALNLTADVPNDLSGVPWSNPMNAWYFAYRSNRQDDDLPTLWKLARQAVAGRLEAETFARALAIHKVALPKLTTGLFWLNPEEFLTLNGVNVPYLERQGIGKSGKVKTLADYHTVLNAAHTLNPDFAALSHLAWLTTQAGKGVAPLNGDAFPFTAFVQDAAQYAADTPKGNMLLDRRYGQLLLSLIRDEDFDHLKPVSSPYSGKIQLAVKLGLNGGAGTEVRPFARAMLFAQESYAEYVTYPPGLTVEAGIPDTNRDEIRTALQNGDLHTTLLSALLSGPELSHPPVLTLNSDFPTIGKIELSGDGQDAQQALATYLASEGKSCRLRVGVTLDPEVLESQDFPEALEAALIYLDGVLAALNHVDQAAWTHRHLEAQEVSTIEATPALVPEVTVDFVPIPGVAFNQILYGPPGTGKTYAVVNKALAVLDPAFLTEFSKDRAALKARYDQLVSAGAVSFVTFHQSFGYEDFIEGIKPVMSGGQLSYRLEDGVFLEAVRAAGGVLPRMDEPEAVASVPTPIQPPEVNPGGQVWRIYIDGTVPVSQVRDKSVARNEIRVGSWLGGSLTMDGRLPAQSKRPADLSSLPDDQLNAQQHAFKDSIRVGDLVLLATKQDRIGAVGVVTGEYRFDPYSDPVFAMDYAHTRPVRWLAQGLSLDPQQVTGKGFAQQTLQRVASVTPSQVLAHLGPLADRAAVEPVHEDMAPPMRPHVLIIDEINRGNVAKIFGELLTLLEADKRAGAAEALTVTLPLSRRALGIPQSLYVIGTMNTADRSLTLLDAALRRRFVFHPVWPKPEVLPVLTFKDGLSIDLRKFLYAINARIERLLGREQMIGHAYLLGLPATLEGVASALRERILPLLEEYLFEDWGKIREVLGHDGKSEGKQFIEHVGTGPDARYHYNDAAFTDVEAFVRVYSNLNDSAFPFDS